MNVKELRQKLADAPDDARVVVSAPDHEYRPVMTALSTTAFKYGRCMFYEDHGDNHKLNVSDERVQVVVIE